MSREVHVRFCESRGVRFPPATHPLVMCRSREQAGAALKRLRELLAELGLEPKEAKTRIVHLKVGGEGFTFLGFHHQMVRSPARSGKRQVTFLARWPADKAMQHAARLTGKARYRAYGNLDIGITKSAAPWAAMGDSTNQFFYSSKVAPSSMSYQTVYQYPSLNVLAFK